MDFITAKVLRNTLKEFVRTSTWMLFNLVIKTHILEMTEWVQGPAIHRLTRWPMAKYIITLVWISSSEKKQYFTHYAVVLCSKWDTVSKVLNVTCCTLWGFNFISVYYVIEFIIRVRQTLIERGKSSNLENFATESKSDRVEQCSVTNILIDGFNFYHIWLLTACSTLLFMVDAI